MWAVVDRIEGEVAVLLVGEDEVRVDFPRKYLPKGTKEGSVLDLSLESDSRAEEKQRQKNRALLDNLMGHRD